MKCILSLSLLYVYVRPMCSLFFLPQSLFSFIFSLFFVDFSFLFLALIHDSKNDSMKELMEFQVRLNDGIPAFEDRKKSERNKNEKEKRCRNSTLKRRHDGGSIARYALHDKWLRHVYVFLEFPLHVSLICCI